MISSHAVCQSRSSSAAHQLAAIPEWVSVPSGNSTVSSPSEKTQWARQCPGKGLGDCRGEGKEPLADECKRKRTEMPLKGSRMEFSPLAMQSWGGNYQKVKGVNFQGPANEQLTSLFWDSQAHAKPAGTCTHARTCARTNDLRNSPFSAHRSILRNVSVE